MALRFVGDGSAFLIGAPARDLSDEDVGDCGYSVDELKASGLYSDVLGPVGVARATVAAAAPDVVAETTEEGK